MSDAEYDKRSANIESRDANMNQSGSESHSTEQSNAKKFTVKKLKFAPEIDVPPTQNSDGSAEASGKQSPQSPTSSGQQFTYGYATNEAIPMTVFYRSQHSQGHSGKQRPTLQQLRKGFENDREDLTEQGAVIAENEAEGDMLEVGTRGPSKAPKFGWVKGVLIRCLLNIWGVILFRRLAWVVGHAGIGLASIMILLSAMVTTLTTLSMSAVCTNGEIKGGDGK